MEPSTESSEEKVLHELPTRELVKQALEEAKLVARAELLHAKSELRAELAAAKVSAFFLLPAAVLGLCALAVIFVLIAMAIPLPAVAGLAIVAGALCVITALVASVGIARVPKKPMKHTLARLEKYLEIGREELHA